MQATEDTAARTAAEQTPEKTPDPTTGDGAETGGTESNPADGVAAPVEPAPGSGAEEGAGSPMLDSMVWELLPESVQGPLEWLAAYPLLLVLLVTGVGYLVGKLLQAILGQLGHRVTRRTKSDYDDRLIAIARKPALTLPVVLSLFLVTAIVPMPPGVRQFTVSILATVVLFSLLRASLKACHVLLEFLAEQRDRVEIVEARTLPMFDMTAKIVLVAAAGYLALLIWGIDPTAWLASAGVIGIAVGFAARDTLANLFSGLFIVADAPYKLGDFVVLDSGERGEVTHVGLRSTRLLTRDDVEVTIPNAIIANAKIINESGGPWEKYRIRIPVGVAYGSDVDQVCDTLMAIAREHPDIIDYPEPRVRMRAFGESSLDFELLGWVDRPVQRGKVMHETLMTIYKRFAADGIAIPFPQRDLHIVSMPEKPADL